MDNKSNFQPTSTNQLVMVDKKRNYPAMKVTAIKSMSAICIALGVASIGLQVSLFKSTSQLIERGGRLFISLSYFSTFQIQDCCVSHLRGGDL